MSAAQEKLSSAPDETPAEPAVEAAPAAETSAPEPAPEKESTATQRARDEAGRFAAEKADKAAKATKKPAGTAPGGGVHGAASAAPPAAQGPVDGAAPPAPSIEPVSPAATDLKAPSSLTPLEREAFAKAPKEIQEGLVRIDREVRKVMQESAEARRIASQVHQHIGPLEGIARANGMDALSFAGEGAKAMAAVYSGAPAAAVSVIADAISVLNQRTGGQALELLNAALQGQPAPTRAPQHTQPPQPAWDEQRMEAWFGQRQAAQTIREFEATNPEFLEMDRPFEERSEGARRLWQTMTGIAQGSGRNMTLEQLRMAAVRADEEFSAVLEQRKAAEAARTRTAATVQARTAAVSIKDQRAAPITAKPKGLDAAMNAAREKLGM